MIIRSTSKSAEQTKAIGAAIGRAVCGGEIIELSSDIGGGKTTFAKGLALGMDISEPVQSPTFTISRIYHARDDLELHHYDFYRLDDAGIMSAELAESLVQPNAVIIIEWSNVIEDVLPEVRAKITTKVIDETSRYIEFEFPMPQYERLKSAVQNTLNLKSMT